MKILDPNGLVDNIYKYVQINIEIAKVEVQEKIEDAIKKIALICVLVVISMTFLTLLFITIALFLNKILVSSYLGFLVVTVLLGIIGIIIYVNIKSSLHPKKSGDIVDDL